MSNQGCQKLKELSQTAVHPNDLFRQNSTRQGFWEIKQPKSTTHLQIHKMSCKILHCFGKTYRALEQCCWIFTFRSAKNLGIKVSDLQSLRYTDIFSREFGWANLFFHPIHPIPELSTLFHSASQDKRFDHALRNVCVFEFLQRQICWAWSRVDIWLAEFAESNFIN